MVLELPSLQRGKKERERKGEAVEGGVKKVEGMVVPTLSIGHTEGYELNSLQDGLDEPKVGDAG